jgi:hypothetical protein
VIGSRDADLIAAVINTFARDNEALFDQLYQIQYYSRGCLSRDDIWAMAPIERDKWVEFLNKRFKEVGEMLKKQVPVFW